METPVGGMRLGLQDASGAQGADHNEDQPGGWGGKAALCWGGEGPSGLAGRAKERQTGNRMHYKTRRRVFALPSIWHVSAGN